MSLASDRGLGLMTFAVLLILFIASGNLDRNLQSPDAVAAALPAWHLAAFHTLYLDHVGISNIWLLVSKHHVVSNRQPGVVFFAVPFYWVLGHGREFSMFPAVVAASTAAAGAVALVTVTIRRFLGTDLALLTAVVLAFGTSTWSVSADTLWPHAPDQLFLAAAMFLLAKNKLLPAAIAIALTVPVRAHLAVLALVAGIWYAVSRRSLRPVLIFGIPSVVTLAALLAYNHWMFGKWSLTGGYAPYVTTNITTIGEGLNRGSLWGNIAGSLVSLDHGLVIWFPLVVVLAVSLRPAWRTAPDWVRVCSVGGVLYFLIQMKVNYFSGGDRFWSYRLMIEPVTLNVPLLALAARELAVRHRHLTRLAAATAIYGIGAQAIGAIFYSPPNIAYDPWSHFTLWDELSNGGPGPLLVATLTVVAVIASLLWRRPTVGGAPPAESLAPAAPDPAP